MTPGNGKINQNNRPLAKQASFRGEGDDSGREGLPNGQVGSGATNDVLNDKNDVQPFDMNDVMDLAVTEGAPKENETGNNIDQDGNDDLIDEQNGLMAPGNDNDGYNYNDNINDDGDVVVEMQDVDVNVNVNVNVGLQKQDQAGVKDYDGKEFAANLKNQVFIEENVVMDDIVEHIKTEDGSG